MPLKNRILHILFWSVLSAAFIGPGTITAAASAGAGYGFALVWALLFSTIACIVLQEASARITLSSGYNLGQLIKQRFQATAGGRLLIGLVLTAIVLGCAAYEAGNILGGVAGAALVFNVDTSLLSLTVGIIAMLLLWFGSTKQVAQVLGVIVALMGLCFLTTALVVAPNIWELLQASVMPAIPEGSEVLVIGLIGTTVVPYNLFLGSGLKHTQSLREMRWSLSLAILLGGIISIAVLVVGSAISGAFSYEALAAELRQSLGSWADLFFGFGLFAAGLSSALTAPLAGAITARSLLKSTSENSGESGAWRDRGWKYRSAWAGILGIGVLFGVLQVQPVPAIILAQALNGIILPVVAIVLLLVVNEGRLLDRSAMNSNAYNLLMGLIVMVTVLIGLTNVAKALSRVLSVSLMDESIIFWGSLLLTALISWPIARKVKTGRAVN